MADIKRYPFARHLRGNPTLHVRHLRRGRSVHDGTGLSFWFRPLTAVLSEVPVDDRELPLLFHARTADFQDLAVQASVTFRVADPAAASRADRLLRRPRHRAVARHAPGAGRGAAHRDRAAARPRPRRATARCRRCSRPASPRVRDRIVSGLTADTRLAETGIAVIGARVVALRPEPDVEKALRTPTREAIQQEADRSTYERRAVAVERERAIAENELQSKIELARREEQLLEQQGANARRQAQDAAAAAARIDDRGEAGERAAAGLAAARRGHPGARRGRRRPGRPRRSRRTGTCRRRILLALAAQELAGSLPRIGSLVLSPDMLAPLLAESGVRPAAGSAAAGAAVTLAPRVVLVHRRTELRSSPSGTAPAARPRSSCAPAVGGSQTWRTGTERSHGRLTAVAAAIPRTGGAARSNGPTCPGSCSRPDDIIVVVGQDGLVANVAKYLDGQSSSASTRSPAATPGCWCRTSRRPRPACCPLRPGGPAAGRPPHRGTHPW